MKKILGCMRRAIHDYNMIQDGDRIAVGVSGGKDSLTLLEERDIKGFVKQNAIPVIHNPCPADGHTKRQYVKDLLRQQVRENREIKNNLFGAIKRGEICGWRNTSHEIFRNEAKS